MTTEGKLSPEKMLAARAIDVLTSLSEQSLRDLRAGATGGRVRDIQQSLIPRPLLKDLAEALDAAYPGALDAVIAEVYGNEGGR